MPLVTLKEILPKARNEGYAVGAFNIFDQLSMKSVVECAGRLKSPVILQVLPPVVRQFGSRGIAWWAKALAMEHEDIPMVLHLDHGTDLHMIQECIQNDWNSVMIDASTQPLETNIHLSREVMAMAAASGVSVEGEVGCIFSVNERQEIREKDEHLASVNACRVYCQDASVHALAPAIGTAHGLYKDKPNLNCGRLEEIGNSVNAFLVIHGGTGLSPEDFRNLIRAGASKINIATQIYMEYMKTLREFGRDEPECSDPGRFFSVAQENIEARVKELMEIFGCVGRA